MIAIGPMSRVLEWSWHLIDDERHNQLKPILVIYNITNLYRIHHLVVKNLLVHMYICLRATSQERTRVSSSSQCCIIYIRSGMQMRRCVEEEPSKALLDAFVSALRQTSDLWWLRIDKFSIWYFKLIRDGLESY